MKIEDIECPTTIEHALVHVHSALDCMKEDEAKPMGDEDIDLAQIKHDLYTISDILEHIVMLKYPEEEWHIS